MAFPCHRLFLLFLWLIVETQLMKPLQNDGTFLMFATQKVKRWLIKLVVLLLNPSLMLSFADLFNNFVQWRLFVVNFWCEKS